MSLAGAVGAGDRVGPVSCSVDCSSPQNLYHTRCEVCCGQKNFPVDLRITAAGDHRRAGYSLGALIVISVI